MKTQWNLRSSHLTAGTYHFKLIFKYKLIIIFLRGIPVISKDKNPRFKAIAEYLALNTYDVVCLQEVWTDTDFNLIKEMTIDILPHSHYFYR